MMVKTINTSSVHTAKMMSKQFLYHSGQTVLQPTVQQTVKRCTVVSCHNFNSHVGVVTLPHSTSHVLTDAVTTS